MLRYRIKYRYKRALIHWRQWQMSINNTITPDKRKLTPYEEKAIRLWRLCLKDEDTQMAYNTHGVRQIEKEHLFIMFQPGGNNDHIMTIMDVNSNGRSLYEFHIPQKESDYVSECFDLEMEKRMRKVENNKRNIIETDIDKLLAQEEKTSMSK